MLFRSNDFVDVKNRRDELNAEVKSCTERMTALEADIMDLMSQAGISGASTERASCTMKSVQHPAIDDWNLFYDHVAKTGQFELLHKRLSSTAFRERWEAGEAIPGTSTSTVWELSVRRK